MKKKFYFIFSRLINYFHYIWQLKSLGSLQRFLFEQQQLLDIKTTGIPSDYNLIILKISEVRHQFFMKILYQLVTEQLL